jgi:hypothetical protein
MSELASESFNTVPRDCVRLATRMTGGRAWTAASEAVV